MAREITTKTRRQYQERMALYDHNKTRAERTEGRVKNAQGCAIVFLIVLFVGAALWFGTGHN